jgi:hypothetical protein
MTKKRVEAHSSNVERGTGDYWGTGMRNPMGKIRSWSLEGGVPPPKSLKHKPKKLA